jgi:hypothetical protein
MSAPVIERPRAGAPGRTATIPRKATVQPGPAPRVREKPRRDVRPARPVARTRARVVAPGRAQFVLTIMVLLGIGLIATLWLSTGAAVDSYRLQDARAAARDLSERTEQLHRDVAALQSAPALAQRAAALGMVPAKDPARLVVAPDGAVQLVGDPQPAVAPALVVPPPAGLAGTVPAPANPPANEAPADPAITPAAAMAAARPAIEAQITAKKEAEEAAARAAEENAGQDGSGRGGPAQGGPGQDGTGRESPGQDGADRDGGARAATPRTGDAAGEGTSDGATGRSGDRAADSGDPSDHASRDSGRHDEGAGDEAGAGRNAAASAGRSNAGRSNAGRSNTDTG